MWRIIAVLGVLGGQATAQEPCNVEALFEQTKAELSGELAFPETAVFPQIGQVDVTQEGSGCSFMFKFKMYSENYQGEVIDELVWALVFRTWRNGRLSDPHFEIFK